MLEDWVLDSISFSEHTLVSESVMFQSSAASYSCLMRKWAAGENTGLYLEQVYSSKDAIAPPCPWLGWGCTELMHSSRNTQCSLAFVIISKLLSDQEHINLLGCDIICHNMIMLRPNTMTQCHNIGLWGGGWEGYPGNFPVNIQKLMPDGKWASHLTPQNSSFAMFLEEREGGWVGGIFLNLIKIFGSPRVTMQALLCRTSLPFPPKKGTQRILSSFLGSKANLALKRPS